MSFKALSEVWVDLYELTRFRGRRRRVYGPERFVAVRSRSADWGISIDSLKVGAAAYVCIYQSSDPEKICNWLFPGDSVADLDELKIDDHFDSLAIVDCPPEQGQPGYKAFQAALQKRKSAE